MRSVRAPRTGRDAPLLDEKGQTRPSPGADPMTNIYVGNLPYSVNDAELQQMFSEHGAVKSAKVVMDRETGRSRGFGFVEMPDDAEAQAAIAAMNGQDMDGRKLVVNVAKPKAR